MGVVVFQRSLTCRADGYTTRANEGHAGGESAEAVDEDGDEHEGTNTDGWECENKSSQSTWFDEELKGLKGGLKKANVPAKLAEVLYPVVVNDPEMSSISFGKYAVVLTRNMLCDTSQCNVALAAMREIPYLKGMETK